MTVSKHKVENNNKNKLQKEHVMLRKQNAGGEKYRKNIKDSFKKKLIDDYTNDKNQSACYTLDSSTCPVCMNEYNKKHEWYTINPCGHCICKHCADTLFDYGKISDYIWDWNDKFTFRNKCPVCMNRIYWNTQFTLDDGFFVIQNYKHLNHHITGIIEKNISKFKIGPLNRGLNKGIGRLPYDPIFLQLSKKEIESQNDFDKGLTKEVLKVNSIHLIDYNYFRLSEEMQGLKHINELYINSSKLSNLQNGFPFLATLKILKISNANRLKQLPIINNNKIETLHIENCKSLFSNQNDSAFNFINNCKNLKHLILTKNDISTINMSVFSNVEKIRNLESLMLHDNNLSSLPDNIVNAENLRNISIAKNKFIEFPTTFRKFKFIERLNISGNNIKQIPKQIFELQYIQFMYVAKIPNINISKSMNEKIKTLEAPIFHDDKVIILSWNNERAPPLNNGLNIPSNGKPTNKSNFTLIKDFKDGDVPLDPSINQNNFEEIARNLAQNFKKTYQYLLQLLRTFDENENDLQNYPNKTELQEAFKFAYNEVIPKLNELAKTQKNANVPNNKNNTSVYFDDNFNNLQPYQKQFLNQLDNTFNGQNKEMLKNIVSNILVRQNNKDSLIKQFMNQCLQYVNDNTVRNTIKNKYEYIPTFNDSNKLRNFIKEINQNKNKK